MIMKVHAFHEGAERGLTPWKSQAARPRRA